MRGKAAKLLRKAANGDTPRYKELKKSWNTISWIEKTKVRKYVESK
ncbi:MAG: hypothetical protein ACOC2U_04375 [bacterium]